MTLLKIVLVVRLVFHRFTFLAQNCMNKKKVLIAPNKNVCKIKVQKYNKKVFTLMPVA